MSFQRWNRILTWGLLLLPLLASRVEAKKKKSNVQKHAGAYSFTGGTDYEVCTVSKSCETCTFSDQKDIPECNKTGKRETLSCVVFDDGDNEIGTNTKFASCRRTQADEQFLVVRLQVFCLLLGTFAVMSVRRQKMVSSSLFDQRKQQAEQARKDRERDREQSQGIELATREETAPLTDSGLLEVV